MTDKEQIIIDGVDVGGCDSLGHGLYLGKDYYPCTAVRYLYAAGADSCYNFPNCSYKKVMKELFNKTQECEKLKEDYKDFKKLYREKLNKNRKYKKIIEEVKKLTKRLFIEQPPCVVEIDCPYNGGVGFDNHCNEFCQIIIGKQVLDLINKMEGVECN